MNLMLGNLAKKKWFVPIVIITLFLIAISSFNRSIESEENADTLEKRLEDVCIAISGAEKATVMITYEKHDAETFWSASDDASKISGIAVICDSGDDPNVQLKIMNMLKALFDLPSTRITITDRY